MFPIHIQVRRCFLPVNVCLIFGLVTTSCADEPPSLDHVLKGCINYKASFDNLYIDAAWEEFKAGKPIAYSRVVHYQDELRRMRVIVRDAGVYSSTGQKQPNEKAMNGILFDGEKTVSQEYFPSLAASTGLSATNDDISANELGYRTAQIFDGMWPKDVGPRVIQNALFYGFGSSIFWMKEAMRGKARAEIVALDEKNQVYEMRWSDPTEPKALHYLVGIDGGRGWIVTYIRGYQPSDDKLRYEMETKYVDAGAGTWVASEGLKRSWPADGAQDAPPTKETRFKVIDFKVNDDQFDESVFNIVLEPDTAVSDLRYGVNYRVGQEQVFDTDLVRLAKDAKEASQPKTIPIEDDVNPEAKSSRWIWLVIINGGVLALAAIFYLYHKAKVRT